VIRVYDETGNVIETHEHAGEFKRMVNFHSYHAAYLRHYAKGGRHHLTANLVSLFPID
jgi:hypothetical protein